MKQGHEIVLVSGLYLGARSAYVKINFLYNKHKQAMISFQGMADNGLVLSIRKKISCEINIKNYKI